MKLATMALFAFASAAAALEPLYKVNLHKLALIEEERLVTKYTDAIVADLYYSIVEEAKLGYTTFISELVECPADDAFNKKPQLYDLIISNVFAEMPKKFPDADISYDAATDVYTISW